MGSGFRCTEYEVGWILVFDVRSTRLAGFGFRCTEYEVGWTRISMYGVRDWLGSDFKCAEHDLKLIVKKLGKGT